MRDWAALLRAAAEHGVLYALFDALRDAIPPAAAREAEAALAIQALECELSLRALGACLEALDASGVRAVALKGPLLAERLYGSPLARASVDLDLLVLPSELERAMAALARAGYQAGSAREVRGYRRHHHHVPLGHAAYPTVELHFAAYVGFGVELAAAPLLARSIPWQSPSTGLRARVLRAEDELVYLAVHGAGHRFARLVWLYDLKLLARAHPSWTARDLLEHAQALGVRRAVGASLHELDRALQTAVEGARAADLVDPFARIALPLLRGATSGRRSARLETAKNVAATTLFCDSPGRALGHLAKKVMADLPRRLRSRSRFSR